MRYLIRLSLTAYSGLESADGGMYRDRDKKKKQSGKWQSSVGS